MGIIASWLIYTFAIIITAYLLPGVTVASFGAALITGLVLGILNVLLKPLLIILTLPINILTLGLFTLVINAILILIAAKLVDGFKVDGFWWALLFALVLSVINSILSQIRW